MADGLIDSHCHLTYPELLGQIGAVMARARAAGVGEMVTIATDLADAERAMGLAGLHDGIHVVCGIHPHGAGKVEEGGDRELESLVNRNAHRAGAPEKTRNAEFGTRNGEEAARETSGRIGISDLKSQMPEGNVDAGSIVICGVGEMGLDYHYDFADRESQKRVFRRQLEIATGAGKSVVIHCREAHDEVMAILGEFPMVTRVVFHCFTGTVAEAREILDRGYWISLTGVVTFKRSEELREVARMIPADRLMVETDSPYLSPEPVRNVRPNEPSHLPYTAACIARARGMEEGELAGMTAENTRRFFSLPGGQ